MLRIRPLLATPLLAVLAASLPAGAEPARSSVSSVPELPAADELADTALSAWQDLRSSLAPDSGDPALERHVATRVLQLTAGLAIPGMALPSIDRGEIPHLEVMPVKGAVLTSRFGTRRDPINRRLKRHEGCDFSADPGTPVHAAAAGTVIKAGRMHGYGRIVFIDHGAGFVTRYGHLSAILVREGDHVPAGARIGKVGMSGRATGPHLHFELRVLGQAVDPLPALGIEVRSFGERLSDLLALPFREHQRDRRHRRHRHDRS